MYHLINENAALVIDSIDQKHIESYDYLMANLGSCHTEDYQKRFKYFWKINLARANKEFVDFYFEMLQELYQGADFDVEHIASELYRIPLNNSGRNTLQFSFSTKMLHMVNPNLPIYDSMVRDFYFFKEPNSKLSIDIRLEQVVGFYDFLKAEYSRILKEALLEETIQLFIEKRKPAHFTKEKIIDTVIWGFVACLNGGALVVNKMSYR
jgi:hypothetical protein